MTVARLLRAGIYALWATAAVLVVLNVAARIDLAYERGYRDGLIYAGATLTPPTTTERFLPIESSVVWLWDDGRRILVCHAPLVEPRACSGRTLPDFTWFEDGRLVGGDA